MGQNPVYWPKYREPLLRSGRLVAALRRHGRTCGMTAVASDLALVRARVFAELAAILVVGRNPAFARGVGALFRFGYHGYSSLIRDPAQR